MVGIASGGEPAWVGVQWRQGVGTQWEAQGGASRSPRSPWQAGGTEQVRWQQGWLGDAGTLGPCTVDGCTEGAARRPW